MRIILRSIKIDDGTKIVKWRNSKKVASHCFNKAPITLESNDEFYKRNIETGKYKQYIVERIDEDFGVSSYPIATVYLKDIDVENQRCELCIFTSDDEEWNTDSQRIAVDKILNIAFDEIGMHKVYSYVYSDNVDEIELMVNSGLCVEAILEEEARDIEGKFVSVTRMKIMEGEYRKYHR